MLKIIRLQYTYSNKTAVIANVVNTDHCTAITVFHLNTHTAA
jgi:hypothetical protein